MVEDISDESYFDPSEHTAQEVIEHIYSLDDPCDKDTILGLEIANLERAEVLSEFGISEVITIDNRGK